ncbi:BfmA/BtgA family mobilization protein [Zunongwangia sp. HGR-M22]|uniref:BfmA/BtgA family mobilization protein n=1 Tax=Zunongwangia sp. HGR-M22 TaxID=3015168 RepID=UPI0022DD6044|nr:BfmA/BtgA family mobilization protein [Zunongwangia sp. HGR-M22]WBL26739.1 BfmA/BtgA family mobilization protein [Zunongwangia sp. HGR-M22]
MDEDFKKEHFTNLSIKAPVAKKFRKYARHLGCSQSMCLLLMLEFFETNRLSPKEQMGPHMQTLERLVKKRISALIAIVRDIEKHQTKPTALMLQTLFENDQTPEESLSDTPKFVERKFQKKQQPKVQFREKKYHP